ncbi:MAG: GIY-YIG nuclease family protein [Verrucomicrobia bacterium]|nr:GIY-YIG nuclease family protein [Verrucomicrobiota bacterium]
MFHVYVITSETHPERYYIGFSSRPDDRLTEHNAGKNLSTANFRPWRFAALLSFLSEETSPRRLRLREATSGRPDSAEALDVPSPNRGEVCPT